MHAQLLVREISKETDMRGRQVNTIVRSVSPVQCVYSDLWNETCNQCNKVLSVWMLALEHSADVLWTLWCPNAVVTVRKTSFHSRPSINRELG